VKNTKEAARQKCDSIFIRYYDKMKNGPIGSMTIFHGLETGGFKFDTTNSITLLTISIVIQQYNGIECCRSSLVAE